MSAVQSTVQSTRETKRWYQHPLVSLVLAPIIVPVLTGIGSVWATQSRTIERVTAVEQQQTQTSKTIDERRAERDRQIEEIKVQVVPRDENVAHWKSEQDALDDIRREQQHTNERVDKIYELLMQEKGL